MFSKAYKISVVTEQFLVPAMAKAIEDFGASGYTMVMAGGQGSHHHHDLSVRASLVEGFSNVKIEVIVLEEDLAHQLAQKIYQQFFAEGYPGIVSLESVEVLRADKFHLEGPSSH